MAHYCDVFISLRFCEAERAGRALQQSLQNRGLRVFLCNETPGSDVAAAIIQALDGCKMAVILGTKSYGKDTKIGFSTSDELVFIKDQRKPFFLVKMCDAFEDPVTQFRLPQNILYHPWQPNLDNPNIHVPTDLVDGIVAKLQVTSATVRSGW